MWYDDVLKKSQEFSKVVINDSKTPSGRPHVGSLRGVLVHDALYRMGVHRGMNVEYIYGIDDYDPLDGLPADASPDLVAQMGKPLCQIAAPDDSAAANLADHYIKEFLDIFTELNVGARIYRMRDIYQSGQLNEAIDTILTKADIVRRIYYEVSGAKRSEKWLPLQVICEQCGRIGTTETFDYDGKSVTYRCRPDLVTWAQGCGYQGRMAPFDGAGKLPWKLEWIAKWKTFGINVEGAGKDHSTKGGSRDVANQCYRAIFSQRPPIDVPYEFFLVGGSKMSSSQGVGNTARDMADLLPPEVLRFLLVRTPPKRAVNFIADSNYIVKLFNDFDRLVQNVNSDDSVDSDEKSIYRLSTIENKIENTPASFSLLYALSQLPHINIVEAISDRRRTPLTQQQCSLIEQRLQSVRCWLKHYGNEEDRIVVQDVLPLAAQQLSIMQIAFLHTLADLLGEQPIQEEEGQQLIFNAARLTPIKPEYAFIALYRVLLDREKGPKGGALVAYLKRQMLQERLRALALDKIRWWEESAIYQDEAVLWLRQHQDRITEVSITIISPSIIEWRITLSDGKCHLLRLWVSADTTDTAILESQQYLMAAGISASVLEFP